MWDWLVYGTFTEIVRLAGKIVKVGRTLSNGHTTVDDIQRAMTYRCTSRSLVPTHSLAALGSLQNRQIIVNFGSHHHGNRGFPFTAVTYVRCVPYVKCVTYVRYNIQQVREVRGVQVHPCCPSPPSVPEYLGYQLGQERQQCP